MSHLGESCWPCATQGRGEVHGRWNFCLQCLKAYVGALPDVAMRATLRKALEEEAAGEGSVGPGGGAASQGSDDGRVDQG